MSATPSPLARSAHRAGSAALIAVVTGGVVSLLFANPEAEPAGLASDPPAPAVTVTTAVSAPAAAPTTTPSASAMSPASTTPVPADPRTVAAAWYATRYRLPTDKVTVLQADQLPRGRVRVLLMIHRANGRLGSAIVTLARTGNGWKVVGR